jgi:hypothetical protein
MVMSCIRCADQQHKTVLEQQMLARFKKGLLLTSSYSGLGSAELGAAMVASEANH